MRRIKRFVAHMQAEWAIRHRRAEIAKELQRHFNLVELPTLISGGSKGHDSAYQVKAGGQVIGMLRLLNNFKNRPIPVGNMPFVLENGPARIEREFQAYSMATPLTPKPLWRTEDALLCTYVPHRSLHTQMKRKPERVWEYIRAGAKALNELHQKDLTHMDASLANMLSDGQLHVTLIDFEYSPAPNINFATQRVYDHLRLVESTWKFIPGSLRDEFAPWIAEVMGYIGDEVQHVNLQQLEPALGRILAYQPLGPQIRRLFSV